MQKVILKVVGVTLAAALVAALLVLSLIENNVRVGIVAPISCVVFACSLWVLHKIAQAST